MLTPQCKQDHMLYYPATVINLRWLWLGVFSASGTNTWFAKTICIKQQKCATDRQHQMELDCVYLAAWLPNLDLAPLGILSKHICLNTDTGLTFSVLRGHVK